MILSLLGKKLNLTVVLCLVVIASILLPGCGGGGGGSNGGRSVKIYAGADPKGDYIAVTIDSSAQTMIYHNYTTGEHFGPYAYNTLTEPDRNYGFHNLYATGVIPDYPTPNCYAEFIIMDGVALILQMFDNNATPADFSDDICDGNPIFAYYRRTVNVDTYRGRAFNWVGYKMGADDGNFEVGFAAFDTNTTTPAGRLYGAAYNNRAETDGWPGYVRGIKNLNDSDLGTGSFIYDAGVVANTFGSLTLIDTDSGDFVFDSGPGAGAGFAIRQADTKDWQPVYNGTYFIIMYKNVDSESQPQEVDVAKLVFSGNGNFEIYEPINAASPSLNGSFIDIETYPNGPRPPGAAPIPFATQIRDISSCGSAAATVVRNAYLCHGGFVWENPARDQTAFLMLDPAGRYLCFASFEKNGGLTHYSFGFGIKDPLY